MLLMAACVAHALAPGFTFRGYTVFGIMFMVFIPLASLTLMQRIDRIFALLDDRTTKP
jgi:hypothetical protein